MALAKYTAQDVLGRLDEDAKHKQAFFPDLEHGNNYHVDCRLTAYGDTQHWVIVIEQLSVNPRSGYVGGIATDLFYHGDAIIVLPCPPGWGTDCHVQTVSPVSAGSAPLLLAGECQDINLAATDLRIRHEPVPIRTDREFYSSRGIEVESTTHEEIDESIANVRIYRKGDDIGLAMAAHEERRSRVGSFELCTWHLARGLVPEYRQALLATHEERRRGVPPGLPLLLQVDAWDHPRLMEGELPGDCESFRLVAAVLATGDSQRYKPTATPNTHWSNWPMSGSL